MPRSHSRQLARACNERLSDLLEPGAIANLVHDVFLCPAVQNLGESYELRSGSGKHVLGSDQDTLEFKEFLALVLPSLSSMSFIEATERAVKRSSMTEQGWARQERRESIARASSARGVPVKSRRAPAAEVAPMPE